MCYKIAVATLAMNLIIVSGFLLLALFLFGVEEGIFLCNIATCDFRAKMKQLTSEFLSIRVGKISVETIIEILITVAFIGIMGRYTVRK